MLCWRRWRVAGCRRKGREGWRRAHGLAHPQAPETQLRHLQEARRHHDDHLDFALLRDHYVLCRIYCGEREWRGELLPLAPHWNADHYLASDRRPGVHGALSLPVPLQVGLHARGNGAIESEIWKFRTSTGEYDMTKQAEAS